MATKLSPSAARVLTIAFWILLLLAFGTMRAWREDSRRKAEQKRQQELYQAARKEEIRRFMDEADMRARQEQEKQIKANIKAESDQLRTR